MTEVYHSRIDVPYNQEVIRQQDTIPGPNRIPDRTRGSSASTMTTGHNPYEYDNEYGGVDLIGA